MRPDAYHAVRPLLSTTHPVFLASLPETPWREHVAPRLIDLHFSEPDYAARVLLWERSLAQAGADFAAEEIEALADRFVFTPGQIEYAVATALDARTMRARGRRSKRLDADGLFAAARRQSGHALGRLAVKAVTIYTWEDLVLPDATLQRLREIAAAIEFRHVVYSEWGFGRQSAAGTGLKTLFAGDSGTGKTMAAGIIAKGLGLEMYKIDLSGVVSKYIGETEKNLDRIFRAAACSNAILFFDEADALFGKRSEVRDAHDRYANIEVAYLLQKLEEFEGIVILASNLSKNIDEAFSRRMHYVVDFPMPSESERIELWRRMFPRQVPLGADVDFPFLAKQFAIAGGDICNVTLDAAFLAAQDGRVVTMKLVVRALARQMTKQGRVATPTDFKQYYGLIGHQDGRE
jgi:SpoVK/Ycf46/Vps4 family AAA+-type ATPase